MDLNTKLLDIFRVLSTSNKLNYYKNGGVKIKTQDNKTLLTLDQQSITAPVLKINEMFNYKSPLKDNFVNISRLESFINRLDNNQFLVRLNHIGFCYKVKSQAQEREKIKREVSKTLWHLYEMESNDAGLWLFIGNNSYWQDPMIELLPIEKTDDRWVNYWLPHIQIDIDTSLPGEKIEQIIKEVFTGKVFPFRSCVIDKVIYSIRARLGIVSGVNIVFDFATKERDVKYSRKHLLKLHA